MDESPARRSSLRQTQSNTPRAAAPHRAGAGGQPSASGDEPSLGAANASSADDLSRSTTRSSSGRTSIGHALRVQIPSVAPPVRRSTLTSASTPKSPASQPQSRATGRPASPRTPKSTAASAPPSTGPFTHSPGVSLTSYQFPPNLPSLAATSPPRGLSSPRLASANTASPKSGSSPRAFSQGLSEGEGDAFARHALGSSGGSQRRKPPPPLALGMRKGLISKGKGMARGDSSDSSEVDGESENWDDDEPATRYGQPKPMEDEGGMESLRSPGNYQQRTSPPSAKVERNFSKDEERDTLSNLFTFPSPLLGTSIPNSHLDFSPHDATPDADADDEGGEGDIAATGFSFVSSSSGGASSLSRGDHQQYGSSSSSSGFGPLRQYNGLGLGLPFSMSAAANLSSLSSALSFPPSQPLASPNQRDLPRTPRGERSRSASGRSASGPESPLTDRRQLIGLGELATPRWTSGALERRWGTPYDDKRDGRRRASGDDVEFDVLGSYGVEEPDPMPPLLRNPSAESPTIARAPGLRSSDRPPSGYDQFSARSYPTHAIHPSTLFPTTGSSHSHSLSSTSTGLLEFANEPAHFSQPDFTSQPSPVYSLEAVSIKDLDTTEDTLLLAQETLRHSQLADDSPKRFESAMQKRRSMGAAASAPNSAVGPAWTIAPDSDVVGLGFDYDSNGGTGANSTTMPPNPRRASSGSMGASSSRRSSSGRSYSVDGKAPAKTTAHRRQSASKSGFAHLPPSPAALMTTQVMAAAVANVHAPSLPSTVPSSVSMATSTPGTPAAAWSQSTPSGRTPDLTRISHHSFNSHHSSPSLIAASILRQTRDLELQGVDMDTAASVDEGTAEALRKLDGLSSPRMSRVFTSGTAVPASKIRTTSRSGEAPLPGTLSQRDSEELRIKRRTRTSTGGSSAGLAKDIESAMMGGGEDGPRSALFISPSRSQPVSSGGSPAPVLPSPTFISSGSSTVQMPRSPLTPQAQSQPQATSSSAVRTPSQSRPGSSGYDVPFPSISPFKRGSSSSASLTAGTSTSASGSHDSTSSTSISGSSFATTVARSASSKNRRGSAGSDVSSTQSSGDGAAPRLERADSTGEVELARDIPPVPPLPKDWETYRPSTAGTSTSSAQNSPWFDSNHRRPSESSSYAESTLLSPRAAEMEPSLSSNSSASFGKPPPRKWSISNAFSKSSRSPKAPTVKESASYTDLIAASNRDRKTSFGSHISQSGYPRRMAASTNDIVGLANGTHEHATPSTGSFGRSSFRNEKHASSISRARTSSQSSSSTTRTTNANNPPTIAAAPPPSVVTTSPGRSRSSLLSPRRTPSGIPFFSRKSSTTTPSPNLDKLESSPPDERSGRKSILGLNFLRSSASRKDKEKAPPSPVFKRQTISAVPTAKPDTRIAEEFGRRASVAAKTTSLMTRKRGKTLGSVDDSMSFDTKSVSLPPMQMSALSPSTIRRVDSLSSTHSSSSISSKTTSNVTPSRLQPPASRASKLQESVKANLPTIAGSPSSHTFPPMSEPRPPVVSPAATPPPKSHTPTKIPRLYQRSTVVTSPRLTPRGLDTSRNTSPAAPTIAPKPTTRRLSSYSSTTPETTTTHLSSSASSSNILSESDAFSSDFGFVNREPGLAPGEKTLSTRRRLDSETSQIPRSRSTTLGGSLAANRASKDPLDSSTSSRAGTVLPRATRRQSAIGEEGKGPLATPARSQPRTTSLSAIKGQGASDSSNSSTSTVVASSSRKTLTKGADLASSTSSRRVSTVSTTESLASSRSTRSMASKMAIPSRVSKSSTTPSLSPAPTESGRSSAASSNYGVGVSEEELRGDEEMSAYVRRQQAKKMSAGMSADTIRKMFEFPDPTEPLPPLDSRDALSLYSRYLSPYEKDEIREHEKVYFVGPNCDKKPATKDNPTNNFGFDDDRGDYLLVPHDHILYRYEVIDVLGKGSFGQVLQCRDHRTGEMVAIKIIRNKKRFHHQALVEIKVLDNLVKWDPDEKHFVIRMVDSFTFRGHLCIVTELLSINLYELVKANSFAGFSTILIRRFTIQILGSLSLLRHHRVVHCDLKPENILLKHPAKSAIKVIDFGSSCFEHEKVYTYIQSRFYRSPEVILGMNYHMAIDMWSLGCIIAEMYTGYPIFPGENEQEQLACIMEVMGLPEKYLVDRSSRKRLFFDSTGAPRPVVNSKGRRRRPGSKTLAQVLKSDDELFVDFITKCLTWDPDRRLKPDPALRHPWIVAARSRAMSPLIPPRSSRSSLAPSHQSGSSTTSSPAISTPRKKVASTAGASTAPVQRTRTQSNATASAAAPARLSSKGSMGLPPSSTRYTLRTGS